MATAPRGALPALATTRCRGVIARGPPGDASQWLPQHGFVPGMGAPRVFRVGFNSGHMQATLPGGTPWNWGSDAAAANRGIGGTGAFDPAFTSHYYRPVGSAPAAAPSGAGIDNTNYNKTPYVAPAPSSAPSGGSGNPFQDLASQFLFPGGGPGSEGPIFKRSPAPEHHGLAAPGYGMSWDPKYGGVYGIGGVPLGSSPSAPIPPKGLPDVSGTSWANNRAGIALNAPLAQGAQGISAVPSVPWTPGIAAPGGGTAPGSIGPFGVPPAVAAHAPGGGGAPGAGAAQGLGSGSGSYGAGSPAPATQIGGVDPLQGTGAGGIGITPGGGLDTALGLAAGAFPGLGQAAQTVAKLGSRAIQFGSQAIGIGLQGAMDTWIPFGGSKTRSGWLGHQDYRRLCGLAPGAAEHCGQREQGRRSRAAAHPSRPPTSTRTPLSTAPATANRPGPINNITVNNQRATEDGTGRDMNRRIAIGHPAWSSDSATRTLWAKT